MNPSYFTPLVRRVGAVSLGALLVGMWFFHFFISPPPEVIRDRTLDALRTHNAAALCSLADPDELRILGLTPQKVSAILTQTLGQGELPLTRVSKMDEVPSDQSVWLASAENTSDRKQQLPVAIVQNPDGKWRLNLSFLLRSSCIWARGRAGAALFRQLAHAHQINGLREQSGDYITLEELEARSAPPPVEAHP